jgi:hypothetical protein
MVKSMLIKIEKRSDNLTDYKRMISYMYQYERGVKKKNVGYARIETRNGQCKITLHMQLLGQLNSIFPTYLIKRENEEIKLIYLGDSMLKNQILESRLSADETNIMGSGCRFSDIGGILLFLNDEVFFATEWDDKPIVAEVIIQALKPKSKEKLPEEAGKKDIYQEASQPKINSREDDHIQSDTIIAEAQKNMKSNVQNDAYDQKENILKNTIREEHMESFYKQPRGFEIAKRPDSQQSKQNDVSVVGKSYHSVNDEKTSAFIIKEEDTEKKDELNGNNIINKVGEIEGTQKFDNIEDMIWQKDESEKCQKKAENIEPINMESITDDMESEVVKRQKEKLKGKIKEEKEAAVTEETKETDFEIKKEEKIMANQSEEGTEKPEHPVAARFFENYSRIYPFEDNEVIRCVKIEPKDIGYLPKDLWGLSNNSFLLHAYYNYHHLIFAKIKDRFGCRYIVGVPGIYCNKERFMARMFGLESFKSAAKRELRQGDFGYWYLSVSMNYTSI